MHIQDPEEKRWIQAQVEGVSTEVSKTEQTRILERLNAAEAFEKFLHTKYVGHKRFGLEGAESFIPIIETILNQATSEGITDSVLGMAHRGRLNVLANVVGISYVKYHIGAQGEYTGESGISIKVDMVSNPSHLEAVDPVVEGVTRAKQDMRGLPADFAVLPILVHGDAAFAGQGVVSEVLNLSQLRGYRVGGTIHIVINNQVGFTTNTMDGRSSTYCTDVALTVQAPVFHVNGDDPEACVRVAHLAFAYRQQFHKDVVIDLVCYRRHGHNEGDEPSYTQPEMYRTIEAKRSVRKLYTEALVARGDITVEEAEQALADFSAKLQTALDQTRQSAPPKLEELPDFKKFTSDVWRPFDTSAPQDLLDKVANLLHTFPEDFELHPKLSKQLDARTKLYADGQIDWSLGELLAYGSLLSEGTDVRLTGEDSRRGTFSHRHAVYFDYSTGAEYVPLHDVGEGAGQFFVYDSLLSEYAALGFEYGYSVAHPEALTIWEAQFGDFANGAQVVVDQFISAGEAKWAQQSGLVLFLPHGYEGQGPEHSSGRVERYLQACANDNMTVANVTNAAQMFHILRRQVKRDFRKPLIIMSPKSLLRSRNAYSTITDLVQGSFQPVLDDPRITDRASVRRVVLVTGKIAFEAMDYRDKNGIPAAVVRVEQLYPWPEEKLLDIIASYENAADVVWLQEEPENMGAWTFVLSRITKALGSGHKLQPVCRAESASPAAGAQALHILEQQDIIRRAFAGL
jgi:2-oxoglutarate decarboxylase